MTSIIFFAGRHRDRFSFLWRWVQHQLQSFALLVTIALDHFGSQLNAQCVLQVLIVMLRILLLFQIHCLSCPAGHSCWNDWLSLVLDMERARYSPIGGICPTGSYCPLGSSLPILCPVGTFNNHTGASSVSDCTNFSDTFVVPPNPCVQELSLDTLAPGVKWLTLETWHALLDHTVRKVHPNLFLVCVEHTQSNRRAVISWRLS